MIVQVIMSGIVLLIVPTIVGTLFRKVNIGSGRLPFYWASGQMLLWAAFQIISVPMILLSKRFTETASLYNIFVGAMLVLAVVAGVFEKRRSKANPAQKEEGKKLCKKQIALWIVFTALLLVQLVAGILLAYEEGDDAFYVAISVNTENSDTMYRTLPYSGLATELDARHGLAPFPVWIAYLAKMAQVPAICAAQLVVPMGILLLTYSIYYLLADYLLSEKRENVPFFMILMELLFLFGGYSNYSAENFLLVRATQGKAVIANVILPMLLYLLFVLMKRLQTGEKAGIRYWLLLTFTVIAGCLCSTLGCLLTCMLIGVVGICAAIVYRRRTILIPLASACVVPLLFALLYFVLR